MLALFTEEEGARFRVPCLGSRLMTGAIDPETARALTDDDGLTLAAAMTAAGCDASLLGPRDDLLDGIGRVRRTARRAGPRARPAGRRPRPRRGDLAARPVAAGFRRSRRPRGHGQACRPQRPDAALREHRPRGPPRRRLQRCAGHVRQGDRRAGRRQRGSVGGQSLAGRPGTGRGHAGGNCHHGPFGRREILRGARGGAERPAGVVHPGRSVSTSGCGTGSPGCSPRPG